MHTEQTKEEVKAAQGPSLEKLKINYSAVANATFKFAINMVPQDMDKLLLELQTPHCEGEIPFFKVVGVHMIDETKVIKDKEKNQLVRVQYFKVLVDSTYHVLHKKCAGYRSFLKSKFGLDLEPYADHLDFEK